MKTDIKYKQCNDKLLKEYKKRGEISQFPYGCLYGIDTYTLYYYRESEPNIPIAFISLALEGESLTLYEFEVVKSKQRQRIGQSIISDIQQNGINLINKYFNSINLNPSDKDAYEFWETCGYESEDKETMIWEKK